MFIDCLMAFLVRDWILFALVILIREIKLCQQNDILPNFHQNKICPGMTAIHIC